MSTALIYWAAILIIYGALLAVLGNYEILSAFYHVALLLFPAGLILLKTETLEELGFRAGDLKQGIQWLSLLLLAVIGGTYLRAFFLGKSVDLVFHPSLLLFIAVILAPVSEEIFHRGLLQTKLVKIWGETWGILFPAAMFAVIHVPKLLFAQDYVSVSAPLLPMFSTPIPTFMMFFALGVLFGYIYRDTKSIYYVIAAHGLFNFSLHTFIY